MRRPVLAEDSVGPRATTVNTRISIINKEQPSRCAHRTLRKTILMHYAENLIDIGTCRNFTRMGSWFSPIRHVGFPKQPIKATAKCQGLKTAWQSHSIQASGKLCPKCQGLKTAWQRHLFQAPIQVTAKCQGLKISWQLHWFQVLVKFFLKTSSVQGFVGDVLNTLRLVHRLSVSLPLMQALPERLVKLG